MNRSLLSLVLVLIATLLGACTSMVRLPDGTYHGIHGGSNINHASSYVGRWVEDGRNADGTTKYRELKSGEYINGDSTAGRMAVGATGGIGAAFVNGRAVRSVAEKMSCKDGDKGCGGDNSFSSNTTVNVAVPACSANCAGTAAP